MSSLCVRITVTWRVLGCRRWRTRRRTTRRDDTQHTLKRLVHTQHKKGMKNAPDTRIIPSRHTHGVYVYTVERRGKVATWMETN